MNIEQIKSEFKTQTTLQDAFNSGMKIHPKQLEIEARERAAWMQTGAVRDAVQNSNTIPAGLKRSAVVQEIVTDFARRLLPLNLLSTVFQSVPLQGDDKVQVPYYDLDTGASTSFKGSDGYVAGNTVTAVREIRVGKRDDADVLDDTKQYDRKYQALSVSSQEIARQPFLKVVELARQKTDALASDILAHVFSIVTAANYGAPVITKVAALFDSEDIAELKLACKLWGSEGRSLILESAYDAALLKDTSFKAAFAAGTDRAIKEGKLFPRVMGFAYLENPTLPENGEHLVGMALHKSAIGVAFAPVPPIEEVRNAGTKWEMFVDPATSVVLEYRTFGSPQMDSGSHIIESSYGFEKLNGNALKRIERE